MMKNHHHYQKYAFHPPEVVGVGGGAHIFNSEAFQETYLKENENMYIVRVSHFQNLLP